MSVSSDPITSTEPTNPNTTALIRKGVMSVATGLVTDLVAAAQASMAGRVIEDEENYGFTAGRNAAIDRVSRDPERAEKKIAAQELEIEKLKTQIREREESDGRSKEKLIVLATVFYKAVVVLITKAENPETVWKHIMSAFLVDACGASMGEVQDVTAGGPWAVQKWAQRGRVLLKEE
jgi:hypothetical protein